MVDEQKEALMMAVRDGFDGSVRNAIDGGADVDSRDGFDNTPLILTAKSDDETQLRYLIEQGADVNAKNGAGYTALMKACDYTNVLFVEILLDAGADISIKDSKGDTALDHTIRAHNTGIVKEGFEVIELLTEKTPGGSIDRATINNIALRMAAKDGREGVVESKLEEGAEIDSTDDTGNTALILAAEKNQIKVIKILLEEGANTELRNDGDNSAFDIFWQQ